MRGNVWTDAEAARYVRALSGDEAAMYSDPESDQDELNELNELDEWDASDAPAMGESDELQLLAESLARAGGTPLEALSGDALLQVYNEAAKAQRTLRRAAQALRAL